MVHHMKSRRGGAALNRSELKRLAVKYGVPLTAGLGTAALTAYLAREGGPLHYPGEMRVSPPLEIEMQQLPGSAYAPSGGEFRLKKVASAAVKYGIPIGVLVAAILAHLARDGGPLGRMSLEEIARGLASIHPAVPPHVIPFMGQAHRLGKGGAFDKEMLKKVAKYALPAAAALGTAGLAALTRRGHSGHIDPRVYDPRGPVYSPEEYSETWSSRYID